MSGFVSHKLGVAVRVAPIETFFVKFGLSVSEFRVKISALAKAQKRWLQFCPTFDKPAKTSADILTTYYAIQRQGSGTII